MKGDSEKPYRIVGGASSVWLRPLYPILPHTPTPHFHTPHSPTNKQINNNKLKKVFYLPLQVCCVRGDCGECEGVRG